MEICTRCQRNLCDKCAKSGWKMFQVENEDEETETLPFCRQCVRWMIKQQTKLSERKDE